MVSFYPGQKANELAKGAQERYERAIEWLKIEEEATNKLAEEYGQLQLRVIKDTIKGWECLFQPEILNQVLPPANTTIQSQSDRIIANSGLKILLGLSMWMREYL